MCLKTNKSVLLYHCGVTQIQFSKPKPALNMYFCSVIDSLWVLWLVRGDAPGCCQVWYRRAGCCSVSAASGPERAAGCKSAPPWCGGPRLCHTSSVPRAGSYWGVERDDTYNLEVHCAKLWRSGNTPWHTTYPTGDQGSIPVTNLPIVFTTCLSLHLISCLHKVVK